MAMMAITTKSSIKVKRETMAAQSASGERAGPIQLAHHSASLGSLHGLFRTAGKNTWSARRVGVLQREAASLARRDCVDGTSSSPRSV